MSPPSPSAPPTPNPSPPEAVSTPSSEERLTAIARDLLAPLWRGIDRDYKRKYARNIWEQFESNIRSAAYTQSLPRFIDRITSRLRIDVREQDLVTLTKFTAAADGRATLKALRDETTYLVLLVRVANEERKNAIADL